MTRFCARYTRMCTLAMAFVLWLQAACHAQTTGPASNTSPEQLYQKATATKTVEQCTAIISQLDQTLAAAKTDAERKYLRSLLAWTYNRRGEMYAHDAASAPATNSPGDKTNTDADRATADFEKSLELAPDRWKSWHNLGVCDALAGRLKQSIERFSKVIELRPDYLDARFNRAEVHFELGQFSQAVDDYSEAIRIVPTDASLYARRGDARLQMRDFERALADYQRATELAPESPEFLVDRGDVSRATRQWQKAAEDYRKAISLNQQYGRAYQSAAWLMATCPQGEVRDAQRALEAAQKALALDGEENFVYLDTLAAAYANAARFAQAIEAEQRAIKAAPTAYRKSLQHRLELYQQQQPYRQSASPTTHPELSKQTSAAYPTTR